MLIKLSTWILKFSTGQVTLISLLIMVTFMIFVLPDQAASAQLKTGSYESPDTSFFYTAADLYQSAENYGEEGRQAYIFARWTFDLIYPLVYVAFLTFGISWFFNFLSSWPKNLIITNLLPLLAGLFDYLENTATSLVMSFYPNKLAVIPLLASAFTSIKWILVGLSFLVYFLFASAALFNWINNILKKKK